MTIDDDSTSDRAVCPPLLLLLLLLLCWMSAFARLHSLVPTLTRQLHKGQAGRIAVLGGSKEYHGAPSFAATAALRCGADLAHVFCHPDSAGAIKGFSPDLIVHSVLVC